MALLDWAKTFGRIRTDSLLNALARVGFPVHVVNMIGAIYRGRLFYINDHTGTSSQYRQNARISHGCPLSQFLSIIVQSVMFHDVHDQHLLDPEPAYVVTREVLYADDSPNF